MTLTPPMVNGTISLTSSCTPKLISAMRLKVSGTLVNGSDAGPAGADVESPRGIRAAARPPQFAVPTVPVN